MCYTSTYYSSMSMYEHLWRLKYNTRRRYLYNKCENVFRHQIYVIHIRTRSTYKCVIVFYTQILKSTTMLWAWIFNFFYAKIIITNSMCVCLCACVCVLMAYSVLYFGEQVQVHTQAHTHTCHSILVKNRYNVDWMVKQ